MSTLDPAGPAAAKIALLWWVMCGVFAGVFVLVVVLMYMAMRRTRSATPPLGKTGFVIAGGMALPLLVVIPLLIYSLETSLALRQPAGAFTIQVRGHQWWWEVRIPEHGIVTANEIHIPAGVPIRLELTSADVIHSFWVPRLHGKMDMIPGRTNTFWIQADSPGVYRGQCGEYCGTQHAKMSFEVVALTPDEYRAWVDARIAERKKRREVAEPSRGKVVFRQAGCAVCHTVSHFPEATGLAGPNLTHLGSRRMIAAGNLPNTRTELVNWIVNPHTAKPGVKMPATQLPSEDLNALVDYLETLK